MLARALAAGRAALAAGARSGAEVSRAMRAVAAGEPLVCLDYAVAVDASSLEEADTIDDVGAVRLLIAGQVGPVRLIDNSAALEGADDVPVGAAATGAVRQLERIG